MTAADPARTPAHDGIAVVGMACRYPDADDPAQLWDLVVRKRRAFRRLPAERLAVEDYFDATRTSPDSVYATKAAVLEGWSFDRAAFRVPGSVHRSTDPAHWLALETAAKALADAGAPGGSGLDRERVAVVIGNTLTGEVTRARSMRLRWPYVRSVLEATLEEEGVAGALREQILARGAQRYLAPFPEPDDDFLAGGLANTIAGRICNHFDFHGGGFTVDGACSSSLLAVINACSLLHEGSADLALAGGVDISLDPFELVGFARIGALAEDAMRVYDRRPTGFLPGEGCGVVALMRSADAAASGVRVYAEIRGWGMSSDGAGGITRPEEPGQLLALRRAYARAGIDPAALGLLEGHGTGTAVGDAVELGALTTLRAGARHPAALGSVKANIGHTKAAAGVAGLLKAALSVHHGVLPPTTGCEDPEPRLTAPGAVLNVLDEARSWQAGERIAGVSAFGFGGINTHLVLSGPRRPLRARPAPAPLVPARRAQPATEVVLLSGEDRAELVARLERLAQAAPRLSDAEVHDLACAWGRAPHPGPVRAALLAATPEQLTERARSAARALADCAPGAVATRPGLWVGNAAPGRVTLLFPGQGAPLYRDLGDIGADLGETARPSPSSSSRGYPMAAAPGADTATAQSTIHHASLAGLRWLERLGVRAEAALGHSLGEFAALVWAGALTPQQSTQLVARRGELMAERCTPHTGMLALATDAATAHALCSGTSLVIAGYNGPTAHVAAGPLDELDALAARAAERGIATAALDVAHAFHSPAVAEAAKNFAPHVRATAFGAPRPGLYSTVSGEPCRSAAEAEELTCVQMAAPVRFWNALTRAAPTADLFCEVGPGRTLARLAAPTSVPAVSLDLGATDSRARAESAAALFAAGALHETGALFEGREARPVDPWRERVFIPNPCATPEPGPGRPEPGPGRALAAPDPVPVPEQGRGEPERDLTALVLRLVAQATELEPGAIGPDAHLLSDLHLSSLKVTQLLAEAARQAQLQPPAAPLTMADATLGEIVEVLRELPAAGESAQQPPAGVAPWLRCFTEELHPAPAPYPADRADRPGRVTVVAAESDPRGALARRVLTGTPDGHAELLYVPDADNPALAGAFLTAVTSAVRGGRLVLLTHGSGLSGFAGSLHQEHPELGITVLRTPAGEQGLTNAAALACATPGVLTELALDEDGRCHRPATTALPEPTGGDRLLGPNDVLLVSGGGKGLGYAAALALAVRTGTRLALLGRSDPAADPQLRAHLDRLAERGLSAAYRSADLTDAAATARAVADLQRELGPVTALIHASGVNDPRRFTDLTEAQLRAHLAPKTAGLRHLLGALDPTKLRLLVGFGSVIGRYGLPGECHYALANGQLRQQFEQLARELPGCRSLVLDWSVWSGVGMGERLGVLDQLARLDVTPIPADLGIDLLLRLTETPALPTAVAVHGRMGLPPAPLDAAPTGQARRFLGQPRVHYPGVELVVDTALSGASDPYLADHRIDGLPVLPAVVGLEAMAQTASALAGMPLRLARDVALERPVTLGAEGPRTVRIAALVEDGSVSVVLRSDESAFGADHFRARFPLDAAPEQAGVTPPQDGQQPVPAEELYGPLYFHTGRFRRVGELTALAARHLTARLPQALEAGWFGAGEAQGLLLGSPGRNDATIHALQACVPHRRLLPVGCEELWCAPGPVPGAEGEVTVHGRERHFGAGNYVWDVDARDAQGRLLLRWRGLRLRDVGPLHRRGRWTRRLLSVHLERGALALGLDPALTLRIEPGGEAARSVPPVRPPHGTSRSHCAGLTLTASAPAGTAVDWQQAAPGDTEAVLPAPYQGLFEQLRAVLDEPAHVVAARVWTAAECLAKAGRGPTAPLVLDGVFEDGWVRLRSGAELLAGTVLPAHLAPEGALRETGAQEGRADAVIAVAVLAEAERAGRAGEAHVAAQDVRPPAPGDAGGDQPRRERVLQ
ncbi:SDR family NAD(P)-dependent oxidoreductase [Streptomyces polyrhachis]|uniref:SDR family NAD(P)-dependent oxidoreductase n=1 Tax=Streptomyces polyrhachis TaxID=1282885 RepID=A0ABW2GN23_9ACTN